MVTVMLTDPPLKSNGEPVFSIGLPFSFPPLFHSLISIFRVLREHLHALLEAGRHGAGGFGTHYSQRPP